MRRFTVDEFHRMIDAGILDADERVETLDGWVVTKMTKNPPHEFSVKRVDRWLCQLLPAGWHTRPQMAITLETSEPEPDNAAVRGDESDYRTRHPGPADIGMIVEVADSTLDRDRDIKGLLYARAAIPNYWIVNVVNLQVEVYTEPFASGLSASYRKRQDYGLNDSVPVVIDGKEVGRVAGRDLL